MQKMKKKINVYSTPFLLYKLVKQKIIITKLYITPENYT